VCVFVLCSICRIEAIDERDLIRIIPLIDRIGSEEKRREGEHAIRELRERGERERDFDSLQQTVSSSSSSSLPCGKYLF